MKVEKVVKPVAEAYCQKEAQFQTCCRSTVKEAVQDADEQATCQIDG